MAKRSVVTTYFDNTTPKMIKFEDVEYNDVFIYDGCLYLKMNIVNYISPTDASYCVQHNRFNLSQDTGYYDQYNCFNLSDCVTARLKATDKVYLATVKIHYQVR